MKYLKPSQYMISLFLMISSLSVVSQDLNFATVPPPPGSRPWGFVVGMTQDHLGYMWYATSGYGVHRYDGRNYVAYVHDRTDPNSIATNRTECVLEDSQGIIWIGTTGSGLERLDPVTGQFTHYVHDPEDPESINHNDVRSVFEDHQGVFWVGTRAGLERFDRETGKFEHFVSDPENNNTLSDNCVKTIYEDSDKTLWLGTGEAWGPDSEKDIGGLNKFDRETETFVSYKHDPEDGKSLVDSRVRAIFEDSKGNFWIGTAGDGLHLMDREKGTFQRLPYDPMQPEKLSRPPLSSEPRPGAVDHIIFILEDTLGHIWIGSMGSGVNRYDPETKEIKHFGMENNQSGSIENLLWSGYRSNEGVIWLGSLNDNLYKVDPALPQVMNIEENEGVVSVFQSEENVLWLGAYQGRLIRKNLKTGEKTIFRHDPDDPTSLGRGDVEGMEADENGNFWIASRGGGLTRYLKKTESFQRFVHDINDPGSLDNDTVLVVMRDRFSDLWVGTNKGLNRIKKGESKFTRYQHDPENKNSISDFFAVSDIIEGKEENVLWVSTYGGGLNRLNRSTEKFDHFLEDQFVSSVVTDFDGVIWANSSEGLYQYSRANDSFRKFEDPYGIVQFNNRGIEVDDQNNLWITGSRGVFQINEERSEIREYTKRNGVSLAYFFMRYIYKGLNGDMYFPYYPNGYIRIDPEALSDKLNKPILIIQNFKLGNQTVIPGPESVLKQPIHETKELNLRHDENMFSFDVSAINYSNPEDNRLVYQLENYDKEWRILRFENTAQYYNIPPGNYVFKIRAATNMGAFVSREIAITISAPWWLTGWAYGLYGLLFVIGVISVHRFQKSRLIKAEHEKSRIKELKQAKEIEKAYEELKTTQSQLIQSEKMASLGELTAGIAHEIQNPMNFINNFSEVSQELMKEMKEEIKKGDLKEANEIGEDIEQNLEKITHHGKRASDIVKGMLQHSRSSKGVQELTDINALADEYLRLAYHGLRAKDKSFNAKMKSDYDQRLELLKVVPQDIGRVLLNLITNAFYAVSEKAKNQSSEYQPLVSVRTHKTSMNVEVSVKDNGNGIPKKVLDKIFQPFFTTKPTGKGTGLGLSLSYDIIKAHGGKLEVDSTEHIGTEFKVILPISS